MKRIETKKIIIAPENVEKFRAIMKGIKEKKDAHFAKIFKEIEKKKADGTFQEWFDKNKI